MLASASCAVTSCDDDENMPASFKASDRTFDVSYDGLTKEGDRPMFSLAATASWKVEQTDEWLTLSETQGEHGSYNIFIIAEENTTNKERRGFIEIRMGDKVEMITVNQARKTIELSLSTSTLAVNVLGKTEGGADAKVSVSSNADWSVQLPEGCDWIKATPATGNAGDSEISFQVSPNTTGAVRTAKVEVVAVDYTRSVSITQDFRAFTADIPGEFNEIVLGAEGDDAAFSVDLTCVEAWSVSEKPEWLTITPENGIAGKTHVTVTALPNEGEAREGNLTLTTTSGIKLTIKVSQRAGGMPYDNKEVGFVYFTDDMAWAVGGQDQVGSVNGSNSTTRNIYTWDFAGNGYHDVLAEFQKRYIDLAPAEKTVYAADGYLKFGKGKSQTAFQIKPVLDIAAGTQANVEVSFRAARNQEDKVTLSVAIEGPGEIVGAVNAARTLSAPCEPALNPKNDGNPWRWTSFNVTLKGITADTKIIIGETQFIIDRKCRDGYFRAFIDDIAVKRIANE